MYCTHIFQGPHGPSGAKGEQGDKGVKVSFVMVIKGSYGMKIRSTVSKKNYISTSDWRKLLKYFVCIILIYEVLRFYKIKNVILGVV
jgi:small-conductance mechanosensitive channel